MAVAEMREDETEDTLPDLLRHGLDVVFVGINPSLYSARRGHYFARPTNRFWRAFSRSRLSGPARRALGVAELTPAHDRLLPEHGFGFTDLVKRPTVRAAEVAKEIDAEIDVLTAKLERHRPRFACFHGITGYRRVHLCLAADTAAPALGLQLVRIGVTRLFVVPNPSGANAHATPAEQTRWYDRLADALADQNPL
ncbi:MAG TPA: mismatch-specific DNA-glycosylase [Stellaceae bacterium]|nr:mismatch-specific DNA-glycosylase [Stellaceae bacterium]